MLTVAQFRKVFTENGGNLIGKIIEKNIKGKPEDKQLFAQMLERKEVRHFMVNLLEQKIYEGSLYLRAEDNQVLFGYLDFPVISYMTNDMQVRKHNTKEKV